MRAGAWTGADGRHEAHSQNIKQELCRDSKGSPVSHL